MKKIVIGNDHGGLEYKKLIMEHLSDYEIINVGVDSSDSVDYPDIAKQVCDVVIKENIRGIVICGTGIGISIAANKVKGIRAALCCDEYSAKMARAHNDANVLALGQRVLGVGSMLSIVDAYLNGEFENDRHQKRVDKIKIMEEY